jgi:hypothetical protein
MLTNLPEDSAWAAGMAARLRLVQVSCADAPLGQRRQFLRDTLTQAVNVLPAARRNNCLAALAERFPAWGTAVTPLAPPAALTPEEMVTRLATLAPQLSGETRAAFASQLQLAGLLPKSGVSVPSAGEEGNDLQAAFSLSQPPCAERTVSLLKMLVDLVQKLDEVACKTLKTLPPPPDAKTPQARALDAEDLRQGIKDFLVAENGAAPGSVQQALPRLLEKHCRGMVALMASPVGIAGVPSAGSEFATWFLKNFSPQYIEDDARSENASLPFMMGGLQKRCWGKYAERFGELATPQRVDKQIKEAVAKTAEGIFQIRV